MSNAINKLKELYLALSIKPNFKIIAIGEPIFHTESVPGLIHCIKSYIELKGFELNYSIPCGILYVDHTLIRAVFNDKALYIVVKYSDKTKDEHEIKLEKNVLEFGGKLFIATVINPQSFDEFVNWFESEIIRKEVFCD